MLQQTQAPRVAAKYASFLKKFPTARALARARSADVLREWQGLGYNRRALYLKRAAEHAVREYGGKFPRDYGKLLAMPGVGPATAGDIMIFAWNEPVPVIETNVRSVYIHFFFPGRAKVRDGDIMPFVERTLDRRDPRRWYWALFDYGVYLKKSGNPSRRSAHHARQSPFQGSLRQKRAAVLRLVLSRPRMRKDIVKISGYDRKTVIAVLAALEREGFIRRRADLAYAPA